MSPLMSPLLLYPTLLHRPMLEQQLEEHIPLLAHGAQQTVAVQPVPPLHDHCALAPALLFPLFLTLSRPPDHPRGAEAVDGHRDVLAQGGQQLDEDRRQAAHPEDAQAPGHPLDLIHRTFELLHLVDEVAEAVAQVLVPLEMGADPVPQFGLPAQVPEGLGIGVFQVPVPEQFGAVELVLVKGAGDLRRQLVALAHVVVGEVGTDRGIVVAGEVTAEQSHQPPGQLLAAKGVGLPLIVGCPPGTVTGRAGAGMVLTGAGVGLAAVGGRGGAVQPPSKTRSVLPPRIQFPCQPGRTVPGEWHRDRCGHSQFFGQFQGHPAPHPPALHHDPFPLQRRQRVFAQHPGHPVQQQGQAVAALDEETGPGHAGLHDVRPHMSQAICCGSGSASKPCEKCRSM